MFFCNKWAGRLFPPFLLLIGITSANAFEDDAGAKEGREIEAVHVTATRTEADVQDISAAVTSVSQAQVRSEAPDVLPEMLRGLPGTYFQQTTPGQGIPIIRGLKGSQVLHMVDGMRINNAFFRDAPNQYLGLVDAFAMDRVEIVRGASPSLYGADAMGGVVNFLTPNASFEGVNQKLPETGVEKPRSRSRRPSSATPNIRSSWTRKRRCSHENATK